MGVVPSRFEVLVDEPYVDDAMRVLAKARTPHSQVS
jgi:hypothetical protein